MNIGKLLGGLGRLFLFLLLMGGILVVVSAGDFVVSLKPAVSFDDLLDGTQVEAGDHVEGNVPYVRWTILRRKRLIPSIRTAPGAVLVRPAIIISSRLRKGLSA